MQDKAALSIVISPLVKVEQSLYRPEGFGGVEAPRFHNKQHMMVVSLSAPCISHLSPQEIFLVLISVRG